MTVRYAGASGDFNPIHIDEEFATAVGLPGRILHGLWTMAQVARAHTDAAGGPESSSAWRAVPRHGPCPSRRSPSTAPCARPTTARAIVDTVAEQGGQQIIRNAAWPSSSL